jgi:plastocyanin
MRPRRFLLPLALLVTLACAAPARAVDWTVDVRDFSFTPTVRQVQVGDKVIWRFHDGGHTTTARSGQAEQWDSDLQPGGGIYEHVFTRPGRYDYVCTPHASFMAGTIEVGGDPVADTIDDFRAKRRRKSVTISFTLNEPARVTYRLRGPRRRTVRQGRLEAGPHTFKVRRLARGRYRGTLTVIDDFDNSVRPKNSFVIR